MYTDHVTCADRVTCTVPFQALRPALPSCCLPQAAPRTGPSASPPTTATTATRSSSSTALRPSGSQTASFPSARRSRSRSPCGCGTGPWAGRRRRSCAVRTERVSVAGKARHFGVHWSGCWGRAPCSPVEAPAGRPVYAHCPAWSPGVCSVFKVTAQVFGRLFVLLSGLDHASR